LSLRPSEPLVGRLVRVEPIEERHRAGLRAAMEEAPEILRYMAFPAFEQWFDHSLAVETQIPFTVLVAGREVGSTRYLSIEPEHRRVEIGATWLVRSQWGTGANVETKLLLLKHAFEHWGAMRVEFKTDARNLRTRGSLLALGARFDGVFRKHMLVTAGIRDSAWYSIVDDDWPAVRERLQARLESRT
jgi:RimJ/RimL family protein N-acetyltransferase